MGVIDLSAYKPTPSTLGDANQIRNAFSALETLLNGNLDNNNFGAGLIFDPAKLMQSAAARGDGLVWNGTLWAPAVGGWVTLPAMTYGSTDGHTFTMTYAGDLTGVIEVGHRIKLTNQAATQYFIVTAHVAGTLTLYGGTTYSITNTAITNPFFSRERWPLGFPKSPITWTDILSNATSPSQASPVNGTWYNLGSLSLAIPIGLWRVRYKAVVNTFFAGTFELQHKVTLSTGSTTETDTDFTGVSNAVQNGGGNGLLTTHRELKLLLLAAKTTYFLNAASQNGASLLQFIGSGTNGAPTVIAAECAYL